MTARIGSNKIFLSLENLNKSLMNDLTNRSYDSELNSIETIVHVKKTFIILLFF